jgi:tetratricopeptide (TPR) repeat protein
VAPEGRLGLLERTMKANKNIAVTYYLKGIALQNSKDFITAIESYQNAIKFHTVQKSRPSKKLLPKITLPMHSNPIGISGSGAQVWVHLTECFWRIDKPAVALKCFHKALEEITATQVESVEPCN